MKRTELRAGVTTTWYLDKAGVLTVLAFTALYLAAMVFAGAPWALSVVMLATSLSALAFKIYQRAKDHREALLFFDWLNDQEQAARGQ